MHTHCLTCGRHLRSNESKARGYGTHCYRTIRRAARLLDTYKTAQIDAALELIDDGGIIPLQPGLWEVVSTDGTTTHITCGTTCTCPAGQNDRRCYHTAAVALLTR